jgi:trimeric autotransporter adhesin
MRKNLALICGCILLSASIISYKNFQSDNKVYALEEGEKGEEGYDGPMEIGQLEFEKTKDPALGYVPAERLWNAIEFTNYQKEVFSTARLSTSYAWTERGPIYDVVGPSNGNIRANNEYTSGRMRAIMVDASDATGNTVFAAGVAGGLWKTTNFLTQPANWTIAGDNFASIALTSICQDPSNPDIMYFSTGEAPSNSDAVFGRGVWKSTNHGVTWTQLVSTTNYWRSFKMICDASGNVYLALRTTGSPSQPNGLVRSTDGGTSWTNITPSGMTASNVNCTDIELSSTGRLHASFGYSTGGGGVSNYRYTDNPSTVTTATWTLPTAGLTTAANRIELATVGNIIYAAPTNGSNNVVDLYRSTDGGDNWTQQNGAAFTTSLSNTQGWYNITLAINPNYTDSVIIGGLDAYLSVNGGNTVTRMTYWAGFTAPYVHADHHFMQWYIVGTERRIIIGCDGGIFLSRNNGSTFSDRNRNLSLKQFFSVSLHPTLTNYMIAGAQDNGSHQLNAAGLTSSVEVTGGDGAYVHIDQDEPQYQFTSYIYNQYRRSTNGGTSWSAVNLSSTQGLFINPFDYDDALNVMYCSNGSSAAPNNQLRRWDNPQTGSTNTILTLSALTRASNSNPTAFTVSPFTSDRVYIGSSRGVLVRLDNASSVTAGTADANTTAIGSGSFPVGTINCIAVGTNDNNLLAIFSNYGVSNVWFTSDGGTNWTACDGNLPDMPVRWAVFEPGSNTTVILATEAGVYTTDVLNGGSTTWTANPGFPTVRTDMLKVRTSDNTIAAATHGRGIFTANFNLVLPVRDVRLQASLAGNGKSLLNWTAEDVTSETKFMVQYSHDGSRFTDVNELSSSARRFEHSFGAETGYYRVIATEATRQPVFSNIVSVKNNKPVKGVVLNILPNPVVLNASFELTTNRNGGKFEWQLLNNNGQLIQRGTGTLPDAGRIYQPINAAVLPAGRYTLRLSIGGKLYTSPIIKQ